MAFRVSSKADQLAEQLANAIAGEARAQSRLQRATTTLRKWSDFRRRLERKIGEAEVQRIVNRLSAKPARKPAAK